MAKPYKIPDFRKLYPEASEEVIAVLRTTERKMQYQEYDLKTERTMIDPKTQTVQIIPSREDSYERLLEQEVQFEGENQTEESVIQNMQLEQLYKALSLLSEDEQYLIRQLFFEERTERDLAEELKIYHNAVHKRKNRTLKKTQKYFGKFVIRGVQRFLPTWK
ncbi:MAG: sigma-70 family RNA polymerase sigma factor [Butyricicoccus pullicaecorum]|nr:sigma-70 family RNA polymerase sigma factor [Butyricicoccus pullicaecorum]MDO4668460.1 sigma-70 family RNA polymerase sigma factor [Butyricicoccus pullicaecorum]